jgi:thiol-disulfide isomerase/thioredoxin
MKQRVSIYETKVYILFHVNTIKIFFELKMGMQSKFIIVGLAMVIVVGAYLGYALVPEVPGNCKEPVLCDEPEKPEAIPYTGQEPIIAEEESKENENIFSIDINNTDNGADNNRDGNNTDNITDNDSSTRGNTQIEHNTLDYPREVILFWGMGCPECAAEKDFLAEMQDDYPGLEIRMYEVNEDDENLELFIETAKEKGFSASNVPVTLIANLTFSGFRNYEGDLVYNIERRAYAGYRNQMEIAIINLIGEKNE